MVKLKNSSPRQFIEYIRTKELYIFGAGELAENAVDIYCENKPISAIIDNNSALRGTEKRFSDRSVRIISVADFEAEVKENPDNKVLLITPTFYASDIVDQLDAIPAFDGLECYIHMFLRNTNDGSSDFSFTEGPQVIPKKIHYFWIGGNPLPAQFQEYVDGWKRINPDYEVIRWDESNYDFSKIPYMKEAYDNKA